MSDINKNQDLLICTLQHDKDILLSRLRLASLLIDELKSYITNERYGAPTIDDGLSRLRNLTSEDLPLWSFLIMRKKNKYITINKEWYETLLAQDFYHFCYQKPPEYMSENVWFYNYTKLRDKLEAIKRIMGWIFQLNKERSKNDAGYLRKMGIGDCRNINYHNDFTIYLCSMKNDKLVYAACIIGLLSFLILVLGIQLL